MPIRWDSVLVRQLATELDRELEGARLRALRLDGVARDLLLIFRDRTMLWRLHPERGSLSFSEAIDPDAADLRLRARVRGVSAPRDERIIRFDLLPERGSRGPFHLFVELIGNRWNAVVTEGPERTIRHVLVRRDGSRPMRVGSSYQPPSPTSRRAICTGTEWRQILEPIPPERRARELTAVFAWTSPLNAPTILGPSSELATAYGRWIAVAEGDGVEPILVLDGGRCQPYPMPLTGVTAEPVPSVLAGLARCAEVEEEAGAAPAAVALSPELSAALEAAIRHEERRVARLRSELASLDSPDRARSLGDLILARFRELPSGAERATLTDFDGAMVEVQLDPQLRPNENADRYYAEAARIERAAGRLPGLIDEAEVGVRALEDLRDRAVSGSASADEIRAALPLREKRVRGGRAEPSLPYRTYRSSGGLEIRVGRGSRHNDDLTFRHSAPNDVWLHARHTAGAHVILRWGGDGSPPARDLEEAAVLAALASKARTSSSVPVDWTLRKHVRKPRGAAPGAVVPDRVKTVFVSPDEQVAEALSADR